jgi:hypothetical protein
VVAVTLVPADLTPFATIEATKAQAMIDTAMARAARVAPCIRDETLNADNSEAAKGVIRDAVLRWHDSGSGAFTQRSEQRGPFGVQESYDNRQPRKVLFWPTEIEELQSICADHNGVARAGAFSVDTSPVSTDWTGL